ncbi:MBL fold metallo-hydrolase [Robiginitalea sp. IMCC43444]|uniref:MBL fold metallo-hydrolase n=1 Tax=Robiginitalea sp. IMCC43444 TaxID=3459121 RepID=UPI0040425F0A
MKVILHGTRGAYPSSRIENQTYGGNTPCIEVVDGKDRLIVDAGTGIVGLDFDPIYKAKSMNILLTHLHMDHIQGLAFCKPLFNPKMEINIWGPGGSNESLQTRLNRFMSPPLFPIPIRDIPSSIVIQEIPDKEMEIGPFKIKGEFISHPGPTLGYRISSGNKSIAYLPDHEPVIGKNHLFPEDNWISGFSLAYKSDLLIHDSQYSRKEYENKVGWGHSSIAMAAEFCSRTEARHLVLFHHDPAHTDEQRTEMFRKFMKRSEYDFPIELAVQGQEIEL